MCTQTGLVGRRSNRKILAKVGLTGQLLNLAKFRVLSM